MSVTLKLADNDAKLVGEILGEVGKAAVKARTMRSQREGSGLSTSDVTEAVEVGKPVLNAIRRHSYGTAEELIRLGHAFDTAHFANDKGHS